MFAHEKFMFIVVHAFDYTGWPKKVSHYRESSLNRIKNRQPI